jgi:hypothetical protein
MNIQEFRNVAARWSRKLLGGVALTLAAVATTWSPLAVAQPKAVFSNGQTCNYSSFAYNATTQQLDITCTTTQQVVDPLSPSTFSWSGGTTTSNTSTSVTLTRGGGSLGSAYTVDYSFTGTFGDWSLGATAPFTCCGGSVTFQANELSKVVTFNPGPGSGTMYVITSAISGSPQVTALPGTYTFNVTSGTTSPIPVIPLGCATSANYMETFSFGGQKHVFSLKPGESAAVAFTAAAGTNPSVSTTETVNTPASADHEVTVSNCPGDFTKTAPCEYQSNYVGLSMNTTTGTPTGMQAWYQCAIPAGQTMYMNIRQVVKGATSINSCNQASCEVRAQIQGL